MKGGHEATVFSDRLGRRELKVRTVEVWAAFTATRLRDEAPAGSRRVLTTGQKGSYVKFVRRSGQVIDTAIVPKKHEVLPAPSEVF